MNGPYPNARCFNVDPMNVEYIDYSTSKDKRILGSVWPVKF